MALQDLINGLPPSGGTLNLTGMVFNGSGSGEAATINKPDVYLQNGHFTGFATTNAWGNPAIGIAADRATIDGIDIAGGSNPFLMTEKTISPTITGYDGLTIKNTIITRQRHPGAPLRWHGPHTNITLENNTWIASSSNANESIVIGRSNEGNPCAVFGNGLTVRNNTLRQGASSANAGWFGIEIKCHRNILIDDNDLSGGQVLTSFPDCQTVEVKNNFFRMNYWTSGRPWLAVEQAGPLAGGFYVHDNIMDGKGITGNGDLVSINNINYAALTSPVTRIECNTIQNGCYILFHTEWVTNVQKTTVQNNTVPAGVLIDDGNVNRTSNGNFYFNNDADGAVNCGTVAGVLLAQLLSATGISPAVNIRSLFKTGPSIRPWLRGWY